MEQDKNLNFLYECPHRLFDACTVPESALVFGTADEELEDRIVIVLTEVGENEEPT
jgi:hypothetical protein